MAKCTNCIHYFVCKTLKRKMEDYFAEACVAYLNREDCVPVVRCKDCKYWDKYGNLESYCTNPSGVDNFAMPDDFCSYGERKDGE